MGKRQTRRKQQQFSETSTLDEIGVVVYNTGHWAVLSCPQHSGLHTLAAGLRSAQMGQPVLTPLSGKTEYHEATSQQENLTRSAISSRGARPTMYRKYGVTTNRQQ